jgi:hypothetical protein
MAFGLGRRPGRTFRTDGGEDGRWKDRVIKGLDAAIDFPKLNVVLILAENYGGLQFRDRPKVVEVDLQDAATDGFPAR